MLWRKDGLRTAQLVRGCECGRSAARSLFLRQARLVRRRRTRASRRPRGGRAVRSDELRQGDLVGQRRRKRRCPGFAANNVAKPPGGVIYTQMLNHKGGIECDLTITRLAPDRFYIVTGTGFATHDFDWIRRSIPEGMDATLIDVTSANSVLALMGPRARDILQSCCDDDLSNAAFPFMSVARNSARRRAGAGDPRHLCRRTRLGAACPGRFRRHGL